MKRAHASWVFSCASVLLSYPDEASFEADLAAVAGTLGRLPTGAARSGLEHCRQWLAGMSPLEAAATYVETFDLRRQRSLYLTYYRYGDTRDRGAVLAELAQSYRAAGFPLAPGELPDFLPALLELAAAHPRGQALLVEHKDALGSLRAELEGAGSPYAPAVASVALALGPVGRPGKAAARWREDGPPSERVGLGQAVPPTLVALR